MYSMNMKRLLLILCTCFTIAGCKEPHPPTDLTKQTLIPIPVSVEATTKVFELTKDAAIFVEGESAELLGVGEYLAQRLRPASGFELKVSSSKGSPKSGNIYITTSGDAALGEEGYLLTITEDLL